MPSTPPPTASPRAPIATPDTTTAGPPTPAPPLHGVALARLVVVLAAVAGMAGLTVASAGAVGPGGAGSHRPARLARAGVAQVHIESVSTPVLVTAAELAQAEGAQRALAAPAAAPTAAPKTAPAAAPVVSHSASVSAGSSSGAGTDLGTFMVTCYDIHGQTASGDEAGPQSVAVDPSVIPLGTEIYIDGVGYRRADDTGGGVRGHHIDIWESSYSACADFGRQYRDVHRVS